MKAMIYCEEKQRGKLDFYVEVNQGKYFIFSQDLRKGVKHYFEQGVPLEKAIKTNGNHYSDFSIAKVVSKMPSYLKYVEKEYGISIFKGSTLKNNHLFEKHGKRGYVDENDVA